MPTNTSLPTNTPLPPTPTLKPLDTVAASTSTPQTTLTALPATSTPNPTNTPLIASATIKPTITPLPPTATRPTNTPLPTATSKPADTPLPSTATPKPTETPVPPTLAPATPVLLKLMSGESNVQYEVAEFLISQNNTMAVAMGVTSQMNGEIRLDLETPTKSQVGKIVVDIRALKSEGHPNGNGSSRRDSIIRQMWLESDRYPLAEFMPRQIEGLPGRYRIGDALTFKMIGDMKIKTSTQPVTWDVTATYDGNVLRGTATTAIKMTQFGFEPPNIASIVRAGDDVKLRMDFVARK
jgi:polyisoprenoid-binding protein YceI